ncbi:putative phosphoglycerate mutase [Clostridium acetobutylicum]|uniref:Possible sigma factor, diverged member of sigF/sigE/sigG family n=1 Tax=Clostridium acetobutylicum (strain ATCC 824 / DSM 792 / JCM 1419 / IAM 19013 / LMG 5710 / NBRC 13948 / NRRL B-527 / VKM B-1787 / 2291 / W) TaxID=272562 RepID=Q97MM8_CLOAB|nr:MULTISPECIES: histidine phosphatase family protein [Clostridium]AAK78150.1 Possible sigma factor, diverged member of sigF/sigE/sigG family [Clostridium acetobutylicum ATCC 824]ADZ19212.1 putative sigma factor, diverged member of sigF/sigE/sigG family [Clostridium acetobutylicum EA 2018]AEI34399.1 sigF/sigE/sigG family sigma factor [Clostridium acetobutylicum DSM 1731]AWV81957.1 histidine phosphatase family protein [Clostridium acetobutylicum]MBC2395976.1 histidine phosphatase family protein
MSKVTFYFMRHGETIINRAGRVQGWCDGVLTDEGIRVAEYAGEGLSDIEFKAFYSSDLGRAIKTARIVLGKNKRSENAELKEVPELREVYCGKYEGEFEKVMFSDILKYLKVESIEEALRKVPNFERAYVDSCAAMDETNEAEDYDILSKRINKAITDIGEETSKNGGGNVLVVVHGGMLRVLLRNLGYKQHIHNMENCSISTVQYQEGKFRILSINDNSYKRRGKEM